MKGQYPILCNESSPQIFTLLETERKKKFSLGEEIESIDL